MSKRPNLTRQGFVDLIGKRAEWEGDCLIWRKCLRDGVPVFSAPDGKTYNVRRWGMEQTGKNMSGLLACSSCADPLCIAPLHFVALTRQQLQARSAERGVFRRGNVNAAKAAANRSRAVISLEMVRTVRSDFASGLTQAEICRRYGLNKGTVWKLVRHVIRKEEVANSSVFSWRPLAA